MKTRLLLAALLSFNLGLPATHAAVDDTAGHDKAAIRTEGLATTSATVTAINQVSREVTLEGADGEAFVISVGDEVKNLAQIRVGDQITVVYYEAVTIEVLAPGHAEQGVSAAAALDTADPGEKPGATGASEVSIVATVESIDMVAETVTLQGPEGNSRTVRVRNPDNLDKVAVGDQIMITLTRAVAVRVSGPDPSEAELPGEGSQE